MALLLCEEACLSLSRHLSLALFIIYKRWMSRHVPFSLFSSLFLYFSSWQPARRCCSAPVCDMLLLGLTGSLWVSVAFRKLLFCRSSDDWSFVSGPLLSEGKKGTSFSSVLSFSCLCGFISTPAHHLSVTVLPWLGALWICLKTTHKYAKFPYLVSYF